MGKEGYFEFFKKRRVCFHRPGLGALLCLSGAVQSLPRPVSLSRSAELSGVRGHGAGAGAGHSRPSRAAAGGESSAGPGRYREGRRGRGAAPG